MSENSWKTSNQGNEIHLQCRIIQIGTYNCVPKKTVLITRRGIQICVSPKSNPERECTLNFLCASIVKILIHFGKELPIMFVYALPSVSRRVCKLLGMNRKKKEDDYYYCSISNNVFHRRLTILPVEIPKTAVYKIKQIFAGKLDVLSRYKAKEILSRIISHEKRQLKKLEKNDIRKVRNTFQYILNNKNSGTPAVQQLLIFPRNGKNRIAITIADYSRLAKNRFLNDVIIDFYLKYLVENRLPEDIQKRIHVFSSYFYKILTCKPQTNNRSLFVKSYETDSSYTPAQRRHMRVKKWTRNINLFNKDYIIIPINKSSHWFLAIICFPGLTGCRRIRVMQPTEPNKPAVKGERNQIKLGNVITQVKKKKQSVVRKLRGSDKTTGSDRDEAESDGDDFEEGSDSSDEKEPTAPAPIIQPCILIFDSLAGRQSRAREIATLREYLTCEHRAKFSSNHSFSKYNMRGHCPKVPQQNNYTDCGLYVLQYAESFFMNPIKDFNIPIKHLKNWFEEIAATRKREELAKLIRDLMSAYGLDVSKVPNIKFPTSNGTLIENGYGDPKYKEEDEELTDKNDSMLVEEKTIAEV